MGLDRNLESCRAFSDDEYLIRVVLRGYYDRKIAS